MATCKNCDNRGWFTLVDNNGLCDSCQNFVLPDILNHCRIVMESVQIIQKSKRPGTQLSRVEMAIRSLGHLIPYAEKGIPTLTEHPRDLASKLAQGRTEFIEQAIRDQLYSARQKAQDAATDAGKIGGYAKAVEALTKLMDETTDAAPLEAAVVALRAERDAVRFDLLSQKAETTLAKGKTKQAIEIYIEMMMSLRNDSTPDNWQSDRMELARSRILELGGTAPY